VDRTVDLEGERQLRTMNVDDVAWNDLLTAELQAEAASIPK
jgi:hypothetical protein